MTFDISIPDGGWIAAVVEGPTSPVLGDSYAYAHTTPVYVVREDKPPYRNADDARFLAEVVGAIRARVEDSWRSDRDRAAFMAEIDRAREVYLAIAAGR